jgi:hypothetical protein
MTVDIYKEGEENVIAEIAMHTGNLLIVDDVALAGLPAGTNFVSLHVGSVQPQWVPVIATRQGGKRYILISIDDAMDMPTQLTEIVPIETPETNEDATDK